LTSFVTEVRIVIGMKIERFLYSVRMLCPVGWIVIDITSNKSVGVIL